VAEQKSAGEILEAVVEDGQEELSRASTGLAISGLAAGLNISFGAVALGVVGATGGSVGLAALFYPIGFLIDIAGRSQLFTENTITPVTVVLTRFGSLPNMLRLWALVFVFNVLGAIAFAAAVLYGDIYGPLPFRSCSTRSPPSWSTGSGALPSGQFWEAGWWRSWPGWWRLPGTPSPRCSSSTYWPSSSRSAA
jgi:hypothetical protein